MPQYYGPSGKPDYVTLTHDWNLGLLKQMNGTQKSPIPQGRNGIWKKMLYHFDTYHNRFTRAVLRKQMVHNFDEFLGSLRENYEDDQLFDSLILMGEPEPLPIQEHLEERNVFDIDPLDGSQEPEYFEDNEDFISGYDDVDHDDDEYNDPTEIDNSVVAEASQAARSPPPRRSYVEVAEVPHQISSSVITQASQVRTPGVPPKRKGKTCKICRQHKVNNDGCTGGSNQRRCRLLCKECISRDKSVQSALACPGSKLNGQRCPNEPIVCALCEDPSCVGYDPNIQCLYLCQHCMRLRRGVIAARCCPGFSLLNNGDQCPYKSRF